MTPHNHDVGLDPGIEDELAAELARHGRLLHLMKQRMAAWAPQGLDAAAFGLLMAVTKAGPCRQNELAEHTLLDPSTVSRHVAQLVRAGLVERQADAADGRAIRLVASEAGTELAAHLVERRRRMLHDVLGSWPAEDVGHLVALLRRLNDDMEQHRPTQARADRPSTPQMQEN